MTKRELRNEFNEQWKRENPGKYMVWLICYIGDIIPIVVMLSQLLGGELNDKKAGTMAVCVVVVLVMMSICTIIKLEQNKDWKAYLEKNQNRLK